MKIVQINSTCNWGSTGKIAEVIGEKIISNGFQSYIFYGRYGNPSGSVAIKFGNFVSFILHVFISRIADMHGLASVFTTFRMVNKIKKIKPNIIHLHNIHGYYLNYAVLFRYLKKAGIPVVWTLHDCWTFTGHCAYYNSINCLKWKTGCRECKLLKSYPKTAVDGSNRNYRLKKKYFTAIDNIKIITVSDWLRKEVGQSFLDKYPISTTYNGVDTDIFKIYPSVKHTICDNGKTLILGVANIWEERKGLTDFIKLSEIISDEYHILLIGLDKNQISLLPDNGKITGVGRTKSTQDLAELYSSADVYINLSTEETLGMTNIESLACGTPAIVYNTTACPETVTKDVGFVVEMHDLNAILNILEVSIKGKKHLYQNKCREFAVQKFSRIKMCNDYMHSYKEILKTNNN